VIVPSIIDVGSVAVADVSLPTSEEWMIRLECNDSSSLWDSANDKPVFARREKESDDKSPHSKIRLTE